MKLRAVLATLLVLGLACSGGGSGEVQTDEEPATDAVEPTKTAQEPAEEAEEEAVEEAGEEAEDAKDVDAEEAEAEKETKDKVSTTITVSVEEKATIKPKSRKAIIQYAKSKGYTRVTNIETSERCSGTTCTVTVTGLASK